MGFFAFLNQATTPMLQIFAKLHKLCYHITNIHKYLQNGKGKTKKDCSANGGNSQ